MAPVVMALHKLGIGCSLIHTGQHYDRELSQIFIEELGLPKPDASLDVGSGSQAEQTAQALLGLERTFIDIRPPLVLAEGDTNTVLAAALSAVKMGIDVGHVEAGLRSHDLRMPEEHNRRLTDHLSSYLFAPTEVSEANLRSESVWGEIFVTGNTVIDSCLRYMPLAERKSSVLDDVGGDDYCLATAHRAENVDDMATLAELVKLFTSLPIPVVYPIHPRTVNRLKQFGLYERLAGRPGVKLLPPQGYFDFLVLMKHSSFILTDSGGIQEEATAPNIRKKVFVLRRSTERPEAVAAGYAEVVGTEAETSLPKIMAYAENPRTPQGPCPYGDGNSGEKIAGIVKDIQEGGRSHPLTGSSS